MFSKLRIGFPHPWNWSINLRLEKTGDPQSRSGWQKQLLCTSGWRKRCRSRELGFKLGWKWSPRFCSCPKPASRPHMKMLLLNQSGLKSPLSHSPWVCGSSGFSQWGVLFSSSHPLVKVILGRSASPSFPTKLHAGQDMQTTSCGGFEGLRWNPLVELRCQFGCPGINSGRQEKGGCLFLPSGQGEGDPSVPPTPPDPLPPPQAGQISSAKGLQARQ